MNDFFAKFDDFPQWQATRQVDYIAYYLQAIDGNKSVMPKQIGDVADSLSLRKYKRLPQYLSENATSKTGKYVKAPEGGYRLVRSVFDAIDKDVKNEPVKVAVSAQLTSMASQVSKPTENDFLQEAINCYRVEAHRAAIILVWIVTMHHLQSYIFNHKLVEFNTAFAKNPDKKLNKVVNFDDFSDIGESKQIELIRSAGIISNDVRKLLDEKLGVRNSAAHPSGITISGHKATEFALDLISNVLLKYN